MPYLYNSNNNSVKWVHTAPEQLGEGESVSNIYVEPSNEFVPLDIPEKLENLDNRITDLEGTP